MSILKFKLSIILTLLLLLGFCLTGCNRRSLFKFKSYTYSGDINLSKYEWLKDKKIFIDPGHGGKGNTDRFRTGPEGITEEEVNLKVALILEDMLYKAGANAKMSREKDKDVPLEDRVKMVKETRPDLLISLHHNGTSRRMDNVNYPTVLIWGNKRVRPLSYSFAKILIDEFHRIMDEKGKIVSDFSVYKETGTMILRETRYICPGVIGEPGFFSDENHAKRLNDVLYNQREAEAYFYAIARLFERGIPKAEVLISSVVDSESYLKNLIKENNPVIAIKVTSGRKNIGINKKFFKVTLDGIPVKIKGITDELFLINYGKKLYPGGHSLRFSFQNQMGQPSMVYRSGFINEIKKGDYKELISKGLKYISRKTKRKEGLKMLLSALSMGLTDPGADKIIWNIAKTFLWIGDRTNSDYYYAKLHNFYPESKYAKKLAKRFKGYRFPVEYNGKWIDIKYEPSLKDESKKK